MTATTSDLRNWLALQYSDYETENAPVHGTYGLIWFLQAKRDNIFPQSFAVKTLEPELLTSPSKAMDIVHLRREFRLWLALPPTYNVVPALGIDVAVLAADESDEIVRLPVMRMPRLSGSLGEWVGTDNPGIEDRLSALAQAFNGLLYLYEHGFEGHGDLKPANILFADLRGRFILPETGSFPSNEHPWWARVADLGWADAWIDLGFTNKALRQYLGPERLGGSARVVPKQSDVFAMGVIASEILQGRHPAPNLKKILKSEGECERWAHRGERVLDGILSERLRRLITECLQADPAARPGPEDCLHEICVELREIYGHDIEETLRLWRQPVFADDVSVDQHMGWAAVQSRALGPADAHRSREKLEQRIRALRVDDLGTCERWTALAESILLSLDAWDDPDSPLKIKQLRDQAGEHLRSVLGSIDRTKLDAIPPNEDMPSLPAFERLAIAVGQLASLAGIAYEGTAEERVGLSPLVLCAWAFSAASSARSHGEDAGTVDRLLAAAIRHAPEEAAPYYFRAYWAHGRWLVSHALAIRHQLAPNPDDTRRWIDDLQTACRLSPDWREPRQFLESILPRE